jgi:DNA-binding IclR family transcriptional regulator
LTKIVKSVTNALGILEALADRGEMSLIQLSNELNIPKGTVHRLLITLMESHYLGFDDSSKKYRLSPRVVSLAVQTLDDFDFRPSVRPALCDLRDLVGETVHLGVLHDGEVVYIDRVDIDDQVRLVCKIGNRDSLHSTAIGKALLAFADEEEIRTIIETKGLERYTQNTIVDPAMLLQQLALIRQRGYSIDDEESRLGVRCVGFPVRNGFGEVVAAVSITGPAFRFTRGRIAELEPDIINCAKEISARLGYLDEDHHQGKAISTNIQYS